MKRSYKKFAKLISLLLVTALAFSLVSCAGTVEEKKTIAVIAKGESHAFWQEVKRGAQAAADKYGYEIEFSAPVNENKELLNVQAAAMEKAVKGEYSAIVVAAVNEGLVPQLKAAYDKKIPVVEFDSGLFPKDLEKLNEDNTNPVVSKVATSNIMASEIAAENFFNAIKDDIIKAEDEYVVGVIQHDQTQTGLNRAVGFISKLETLAEKDPATKGKLEIEKVVKHGELGDNAYKDALEELYDEEADAIFMTNEGVVKQVFNTIKADKKYDKIKFCGFDSGSAQLEWMRMPTGAKLIGSVAQNSYQIGFQAVEQAVFAAEGKTVNSNVMLSGTWWNADSVDTMLADGLVYEG